MLNQLVINAIKIFTHKLWYVINVIINYVIYVLKKEDD